MSELRPEKVAIRRLWLEEISAMQDEPLIEGRPLYLTLPGAQGLDLDVLVQSGTLSLTSVGGIGKADQWKVVAVESSPSAVLNLQVKFPGLKIIEVPIQSLIRGQGPTAWPVRDDRRLCQAAVINLDLDEPFRGEATATGAVFPVLNFIHKFNVLHTEPNPSRWILFLTLHAQIVGEPPIFREMRSFLVENCSREERFREGAKATLGTHLFELMLGANDVDFAALNAEESQKILGIFVPKKLSQLVGGQGWRVQTKWNLRYGGRRGRAPIVSWIIEFQPESEGSSNPDRIYRESLLTIFEGMRKIAEDGSIQN